MPGPKDDGFFEREAGEEDDSYGDDKEEGTERGRKKSMRKKAERFEDSSEEDDDEDQNEFEKDGFIVDGDEDEEDEEEEEDEEDEAGASGARRKQRERHSRYAEKRKRRRKESEDDDDDDELAEGDYMLLEETGHAVNRKRLRRLKKAAGTDDYGVDDFRDLGDEDDDRYEDGNEERAAVDEDVDDVDEDDDFIDDGGKGRRRRRRQDAAGVSTDAVRAARSVFGDFEDIQDVYRGRSGTRGRPRTEPDAQDSDDAPQHHSSDDLRDESDSERGSVQNAKSRRSGMSSRTNVVGGLSAATSDDVADASAVAARLSLGVRGTISAEEAAIVDRDVPELIQMHMGTRDNVASDEIAREASWVYSGAFANDPGYASCFDPQEVTRKIETVLTYILVDKMDIPFIAQYRKDYIAPELLYSCGDVAEVVNEVTHERQLLHPKGFNAANYDGYDEAFSIEHERGVKPGFDDGFGDWSALWKILDWDKKWAELESLRMSISRLIDASKEKGVPDNFLETAAERCKEAMEGEQLADVERYIRLATEAAVALGTRDDVDVLGLRNPDIPPEAPDESDISRRRKPNQRANRYAEYHRKGYGLLAAKFGISAREFADNVEGALQYGENYQACVPRDAEGDPLEMAGMIQKDLRHMLDSSDNAELAHGREHIEDDPVRLLSAARYLLVKEILAEPRFVQSSRAILELETAMVTAKVTQNGALNVGEGHPLRGYVSVKDKPLAAFVGTADFALMQRAESKGFCTISVRFKPDLEEKLLLILQSSATVSLTASDLVRKWNAERLDLAKEVFDGTIQYLSSEVTEILKKRTGARLCKMLTDAASRRLLLGPVRPFAGEDGAPRVMAVVVTHEGDEDPDPAQASRDAEEAKSKKGGAQPFQRPNAARVTFVNLDRDGMFLNSEEVFGKWLRRAARASAPPEIVARLESFLAKSKPEVIVVGLGSGGKDAVRMRGDLIDVVSKMLVRGKADFLVGKEKSAQAKTAGSLAPLSEQPMDNVDWRYKLVQNHVMSVPEEAARAYSLSNAASIALPVDGMTLVEKRAMALGRLAQEPLSVYAGIAMEEGLAGRFELHRLHFLAPRETRVEALRRAVCRAVCTVGVDVNRMLSVPHMQGMLAFVGGLGPRKAIALIRKIEGQVGEDSGVEALQSRKHLYAQQYLGRCVFMSAAGFLRIRDPRIHVGGSTVEAVAVRRTQLRKKKRRSGRDGDDDLLMFDPLDDSRIHPENYNVAVKIADEALRDENGDMRVSIPMDENGVSNSSRFIACVLDNTEGLALLDLEKYANHLEKLGRGRLYETIKMVATEFQAPFKDCRVSLATPEARAEFFLALGADPYYLRVGAEVTATNCLVNRRETGITCMLPHGLRGFITRQDFSDGETRFEEGALRKFVSNGSEVHCRILGFSYESFEAKLSAKPSVMLDPSLIEFFKPVYDKSNDYIVEYPSELTRRGANVSRNRQGRAPAETHAKKVRETRLKQRAGDIYEHENFHPDATHLVAAEYLRNAPPGEFFIRPSGREIDCFVFTAKFADGSALGGNDERGIIHILCKVKNPMARDHTTKFVVAGTEYDSLDELIATYLTPVVESMSEAVRHPKFRNYTDGEMAAFIKTEKKEHPKRIPYFFTLPQDKMLCFHLHCIPGRETVSVEPVKVLPDGFHLRRVLHKDLNTLINWFKKNCRRTSVPQPGPADRDGRGPGTVSDVVGKSTNAQRNVRVTAGVATPLHDEAPPVLEPGARGPSMAPAVLIAAEATISNPYPRKPLEAPPPPPGRQVRSANPFGRPSHVAPPPPVPPSRGVRANGSSQPYGSAAPVVPPSYGGNWVAGPPPPPPPPPSPPPPPPPPGFHGQDAGGYRRPPGMNPGSGGGFGHAAPYGYAGPRPSHGGGVPQGAAHGYPPSSYGQGYGPPERGPSAGAGIYGPPRVASSVPSGPEDPSMRRGQMPIPAWKKNQQQQQQQEQQQQQQQQQ